MPDPSWTRETPRRGRDVRLKRYKSPWVHLALKHLRGSVYDLLTHTLVLGDDAYSAVMACPSRHGALEDLFE